MGIMLFIGTAANFVIPLYMQVVQGRTGIETSFAIIPYTLSIFLASTFIASLYGRFRPRHIATGGFVVVAGALTLLAFTIQNSWGQTFIVIGLILLGLGQGSIVALVFNTLLSRAPKELAGDVGAWRGLVHNLSGSVGIALISVFAVSVLSGLVISKVDESPILTPEVVAEVNLDNVNFVTNDQLDEVLAETGASAEEVEEAVRINEEARLRALQISLLGLAIRGYVVARPVRLLLIGLNTWPGVIWMFASTNVFTASALSPLLPSVATVNGDAVDRERRGRVADHLAGRVAR